MILEKQEHYIELKTDYDGDFKVTIKSEKGEVLFCQIMKSYNKQIILKGFSLNRHTLMLSPIQFIL